MSETRVASANILHSLNDGEAQRALTATLRDEPHIAALQEWAQGRPQRPAYRATRTGGLSILIHRDWAKIVTGRTLTLAREREDVRETRGAEAIILPEGEPHIILNLHLAAHHDRPANLAAWREGVESVEQWIEDWKGYRRWVIGDVNKDEHEFKGLVSCWRGHKALPTFGKRTIDGIWTSVQSRAVDTISTPSDHNTVIARY